MTFDLVQQNVVIHRDLNLTRAVSAAKCMIKSQFDPNTGKWLTISGGSYYPGDDGHTIGCIFSYETFGPTTFNASIAAVQIIPH